MRRHKAKVKKLRRVVQGINEQIVAYYSQPLAWAAWLVTSAAMAYLGGAVMFWVHAIQRGEAGPAISNLSHWFLDSTLGFVALNPVVFVLLPAAHFVSERLSGGDLRRRTAGFVAVLGLGFALVTVPGPVAHGMIAGEGTPLAQAAEQVFGQDETVAARNLAAPDNSAASESMVQLLAGVPAYLFSAVVALFTLRSSNRARRRLAAAASGRSRRGYGASPAGAAG